MSAENVEIVRAAYEAFGHGDLETVAGHFAQDVEWETPDSLPLGGLVSGRDAVIGNFAQLPSYWSSFSVEPEEFIDAGEYVIVLGTQRAANGKGSFEAPFLHLMKFENGKTILEPGQKFILDGATTELGTNERVGLDYKELPRDLRAGDVLLLNDGLGATSISFWFRRWMVHSRSHKWLIAP